MKSLYWLLFGLLLGPLPARAEGPLFSAGFGFEAASGTYGTGTRTDSLYIPLTLAVYPTERLGFSLEIPYVYQSTSAVNTGVFMGGGGQMTQMQKEVAAMSMGPGSMDTTEPAPDPAKRNRSQSGLGDLTARGGYVLAPEGEWMPRVRPYLFVKIPTADKALGTGAFDMGLAVEFAKRFGNWYTFAEAGYTFQGNSSVLPLKDYPNYNAGAGYAFADRFLPMLIVKGAGAPVQGASDLLEMRVKLKYLATAQTGIEGYLSKGVTRSSPDYGGGLAVFHDF